MSETNTNQSKVAQFREQQRLEEESAYIGLFGSAAVANHKSIMRRAQPDLERIAALFQAGKDEEAVALWESFDWEQGGHQC